MLSTKTRKNQRSLTTLFGTAGVLALMAAGQAGAAVQVQIGPGADLLYGGNYDTDNGDRLNVAVTSGAVSPEDDFVTLAAGTYNVVDFRLNVINADAGLNNQGTVAPMLLSGSPSSYTTLWVGGGFDPTSNGIQTAAAYAPGTQTFTLAAPTDVYAGIFTQNEGAAIPSYAGRNPNFDYYGTTDHDQVFTAPTGPGAAVDTFTNAGLPRAYAFEVNVAAVPEPASLALLGLGGLLIARRRRG